MEPISVTDATFQSEVLQASASVLVDFWAPWCSPCRMIAPVLEQLGASYNHRLKIVKLNVDENQGTAQAFAIRSIPTLIFFKDATVIGKLIGAVPKNQLEERVKKALQLKAN